MGLTALLIYCCVNGGGMRRGHVKPLPCLSPRGKVRSALWKPNNYPAYPIYYLHNHHTLYQPSFISLPHTSPPCQSKSPHATVSHSSVSCGQQHQCNSNSLSLLAVIHEAKKLSKTFPAAVTITFSRVHEESWEGMKFWNFWYSYLSWCMENAVLMGHLYIGMYRES